MEFAYALSNFGSEVHIFNRHNRILKGFDDDITRELMKAMKENGVSFHLGVNYHEIKTVDGKKDILTWTGTFTGFDAILISTGRMPNIASLNLHAACISTENGIITDKHLRTTYFILPSIIEGIPEPLLEAMAAGCACISTACGGSQEVINDGTNGIIVPVKDPDSMFMAFKKLYNVKDKTRYLMAEAMKSAVKFDLNRTYEDFINAINFYTDKKK